MSAISAAPRAEARELSTWLTRPWPVGVAAALVAGSVAGLVVASDVLIRSDWFALFSAYNVLAFAGAGVLWLRRRPQSRVGLLLLVLAAVVGVVSLQGTSFPLAFSIGVLFDPVLAIVWWYLLLTYPSERLTRPAAATFGLGLAAVAFGFVPWFFFSSHIAGATPLARCTPACPTNVLMLADRPGLAGHFGTVEQILRMVFAAAFVALLAVRVAVASRPRRRVLAPVYAAGGVYLAAFGAYGVAAYLIVTDLRVWDSLGWVLTATRITLPLAFLLALVLARMYAAGALATMMRSLWARPGPAEVERVLQGALGDPGLRVALYQAPEERWTDVRGEHIDPGTATDRRWRALRRDGESVAALAYDPALDDDPELVDAAAAAVQLSLDRSRLDAERRLVLSELRESRQRIARRARWSGAGSSATSTTARSSGSSRCG